MAGANSGLIVEAAADLMPLRSREMPLLRIAFLAAVLMVAAGGVGDAWENTPLLNIYQVAYPVVWNGKTIMIGARLQLPAGTKGKMPPVIMMHGTGDIKYSGVYYVAALNGAGIVTFEVDQWGGRGLPGGASSALRISAIICPIVSRLQSLPPPFPDNSTS
jgi:hypothetical protein